jgi:hypothetical protein
MTPNEKQELEAFERWKATKHKGAFLYPWDVWLARASLAAEAAQAQPACPLYCAQPCQHTMMIPALHPAAAEPAQPGLQAQQRIKDDRIEWSCHDQKPAAQAQRLTERQAVAWGGIQRAIREWHRLSIEVEARTPAPISDELIDAVLTKIQAFGLGE